MYYFKNVFYFQVKGNMKKRVFSAFQHRKIFLTINTKIDISVAKLLNTLVWKNMKYEILAETMVAVLISCWHLHSFGYFVDCKEISAQCFEIFGRIISIFNITLFFIMIQRLLRQYQYLWTVFREFSKPLFTQHIDDILAWWQLRRYYRGYEMAAFSAVFNIIVAWLLFVVLVSAFYMVLLTIIWPEWAWNADEHVIVLGIIYLTYTVLKLCQIAVRAYTEQMKYNSSMLDREIIFCKRNFSGLIDIQMIAEIKNDILENTRPFVILGLHMTPTTMNVLKGYFFASGSSMLVKQFLL